MHVRGVDLAVRESGQGLPFFWGHGLLGSMAQEDDADLLDWSEIEHSARLLRYDARGHGRSEATLDPADCRWPELARDMLALADAFGADRPALGGLSMGCATALHAAAAAPDRVEALVLVAPPTAWGTRSRQVRIYRVLAAVIERVGLAPLRWAASLGVGLAPLRWAASLGSLAPSAPHLTKLQSSVAAHLRRADRRAVVTALRGAAASDLREPDALRAVDAPALVLAWRGDPAHPISTAERLAALLPRGDLRVATSLGEVRAWSPVIRDFLAALKPPRPAAAPPPPV
jgi:pimeloyl-ACP methyl ester carboxylesterase